jgi:hypothetical protein
LHSLPSSYRLDSEDGQHRSLPGIADALGEAVVLNHGADPQVFVMDHIVCSDEFRGFFVVEVAPLISDVLMRLGEHHHPFVRGGASVVAVPMDSGVTACHVLATLMAKRTVCCRTVGGDPDMLARECPVIEPAKSPRSPPWGTGER